MKVVKLHDILFERKLTRADLARMTGLSKNWVSDLYYGKLRSEHEESMQKVCNALNVKRSEIIEILPDVIEQEKSGVAGGSLSVSGGRDKVGL